MAIDLENAEIYLINILEHIADLFDIGTENYLLCLYIC